MRYTLPLILMAGPAWAHHEAVVISVLPPLMIWIAAFAATGFATWRIRRRKSDNKHPNSDDES